MEKVNLEKKLGMFSDHWRPRIVGELNGQQVKVVKIRGEFVWHRHESEDEMFMVLRGRMRVETRDRIVTLDAGELVIVPRGVEHRTAADEEAHVLLFEPATTINTGEVRDARTVVRPERI